MNVCVCVCVCVRARARVCTCVCVYTDRYYQIIYSIQLFHSLN